MRKVRKKATFHRISEPPMMTICVEVQSLQKWMALPEAHCFLRVFRFKARDTERLEVWEGDREKNARVIHSSAVEEEC